MDAIQDLLGHEDLKTMMALRPRSGQVYTHIANLAAVQSPLDRIYLGIASPLGIKHTELV